MTDQYAVMGHPVAHSKSPRIHTAFAIQTNQDITYTAIPVTPGGFPQAVARFRESGGKGLNITLPFKEEAWRLAEHRTPRARHAGAANTLWFGPDGTLHADNTDGAGLVRDLTLNQEILIGGARVLLVGAGGAARGVVRPLLAERPQRLVIANRTVSRAESLAALFRSEGPTEGCGFEALKGRSFHLIVNATSASLQGQVPPLPEGILAAQGTCYDMMYGDRATAFQEWGERHGAARSLDGLGMLVEQAAESFYVWRGIRPDTGPVIRMLRDG